MSNLINEEVSPYRKFFESEVSIDTFFADTDFSEIFNKLEKTIELQMGPSIRKIYLEAKENGRLPINSKLPPWILTRLPGSVGFPYSDWFRKYFAYVSFYKYYMVIEEYEIIWLPSENSDNRYQLSYRVAVCDY